MSNPKSSYIFVGKLVSESNDVTAGGIKSHYLEPPRTPRGHCGLILPRGRICLSFEYAQSSACD